MSIFSSRPALRWLVPVTMAVAVIGGGAAAQTISASAEPDLPARSAAQLLVDLQSARTDGVSGTVRTTANLGLPALPNSASGSADLTSLASGSRTLRLWYSGPEKVRLALLGTLGESDFIRNGNDVWIWNSHANKATHLTLPSDQRQAVPDASALPATPQEAADMALKAVDPTTIVETGSNARVAGRSAYELILTPRDTNSLVSEVRLAIDATEHVPLRVLVYAKGETDPAYEVAFTQISFARPDDAQFRFNPPQGATVEEGQAGMSRQAAQSLATNARAVGSGWTTVFVANWPVDTSVGGSAAEDNRRTAMSMLELLPKVSGPWGSGRLLTGKLFSVLLTDDGRILAGAVTPERLYEAARA